MALVVYRSQGDLTATWCSTVSFQLHRQTTVDWKSPEIMLDDVVGSRKPSSSWFRIRTRRSKQLGRAGTTSRLSRADGSLARRVVGSTATGGVLRVGAWPSARRVSTAHTLAGSRARRPAASARFPTALPPLLPLPPPPPFPPPLPPPLLPPLATILAVAPIEKMLIGPMTRFVWLIDTICTR